MPDPDTQWRAVRAEGNALHIWEMRGDIRDAKHAISLPDGTDPEAVLGEVLDDSRATVLCGILGTPRKLPCAPVGGYERNGPIIRIPPLRQASPAVLSSGAETAIAGYLAAHPRFDGVILTLSQQSLWSHVSADEVVSMMAFETPRLANILGVTHQAGPEFNTALSDTLARPERIAAHLAQARTSGSGQELAHLIGAEIAAARPYWLGQFVVVLADDGAEAPYLAALQAQGAMVEASSFNDAFLAGCRLALNP